MESPEGGNSVMLAWVRPDEVEKDSQQATLDLADKVHPVKVRVGDSCRQLRRRCSLTGEHIGISIAKCMQRRQRVDL